MEEHRYSTNTFMNYIMDFNSVLAQQLQPIDQEDPPFPAQLDWMHQYQLHDAALPPQPMDAMETTRSDARRESMCCIVLLLFIH